MQGVWKLARRTATRYPATSPSVYRKFPDGDTDKDGKISAAEFKTGCGKGWIQLADASTTKE